MSPPVHTTQAPAQHSAITNLQKFISAKIVAALRKISRLSFQLYSVLQLTVITSGEPDWQQVNRIIIYFYY